MPGTSGATEIVKGNSEIELLRLFRRGGRYEITTSYFRSFATILISVIPLDGINRET